MHHLPPVTTVKWPVTDVVGWLPTHPRLRLTNVATQLNGKKRKTNMDLDGKNLMT